VVSEALQLAIDHHQAIRLDVAEDIYRRILAVEPSHAHALNGLGLLAFQRGRHELALTSIRGAIDANPREPSFHNNLGIVCRVQGFLAEAIACHQEAIRLQPGFAQAHYGLGNAWQEEGQYDRAVACYQEAARLAPDCAAVYNNMGAAFLNEGLLDRAAACFAHAVRLKPDYALGHSNLLAARHYDPHATPADLFAAHAEYERQHAAALRAGWPVHDNSPQPDRPLRIGFVSPAFFYHAVGYFLVGPLEHVDREQYQTFCYCDSMRRDAMTARLRAAACAWRDVAPLSDDRLWQTIRDDRIDILIDLSGHAGGGTRLLVFARKPAPVQITWMDYVGTTGLRAIDYVIADRLEVPPGHERWYHERVLRLPDGYLCYTPPRFAPPVGPLPASRSPGVTFGSFSFPPKTSPPAIAAWARILHRVPGSRLLLKYRGLDQPAAVEDLRRRFAEHGIGADRVELQGGSPPEEMLNSYNQVDLALDTLPYNGGLTTCEALWMGVPVVTCPGGTFASRHSLSHLTNARFTETIARDLDDYVEIAVRLASDLPRLAALRAGLREQMAASPLCDGRRFAQNLMQLLRDAWRAWCEKQR
jgi:predicted O-linked N-acetylglucosamine transferase (SPINDLY family)